MKKFFTLILSGIFLVSLLTLQIKAYTVSPNSGSFNTGSEQTISIFANPPDDKVTAVQVYITVENASIVPDSLSTSEAEKNKYSITRTCDEDYNGNTESQVCLNFAKTDGFIGNGDLLATFKIKFNGTSGVAQILSDVSTDDFLTGGYLVNMETVPVSNPALAKYTISNNQLPAVGIKDYPILVISLGLILVIVGTGFYIARNKARDASL